MIRLMREGLGKWIVGGIIGVIAAVFVFYGVFTQDPGQTRMVAGTVNGDSIPMGDFNRELNRRLAPFKNMNLDPEQLKMLRVHETVFQEMVNRKLWMQEADRVDLKPSSEEIRAKIREIQAFQKDGHFDLKTYEQVLAANNHTTSSFERLVREDLTENAWMEYFHQVAKVTPSELQTEFELQNNKRFVKFVLITPDDVKSRVSVPAGEIEAYAKDPAKLATIKSRFEAEKERKYKGKTFEQVSHDMIRDDLASQKPEAIEKATAELIEKIKPQLKADKKSEDKLNAFLKPMGLKVGESGAVIRKVGFIPALGEATELIHDMFDPVKMKELAAQPKVYKMVRGTAVTILEKAETPELSKFTPEEREKLRTKVLGSKAQELHNATMTQIRTRAKIQLNSKAMGIADEG